jgi:hypothetical protein
LTEMEFLRKPPKGQMTPTVRYSGAVGIDMLRDDKRTGLPAIELHGFSRLRSSVGRHVSAAWSSLFQISTDPFLPLIVLGVVAAAFVFAFVLRGPPVVVFGVLVIGCLTAFVETKLHRENAQRQGSPDAHPRETQNGSIHDLSEESDAPRNEK